ncbi:hypothetical protein [Neomegalonema sp.]|uniref:hypothetical protein n=1 Tax=Neomegalonema sp. TaxID=2039713 RepID=UPI002615B567|nr:hypothetical protein [Neomegalonema sp.]MDD2869646.1 hypothetical protein [Neomegalonema sp.]
MSDFHVGSAACAEEKLSEDINIIKDDPFSFWFGGGDYVDLISPSDKRWDATTVSNKFTIKDLGNLGDAQIRYVAKILEPIKHKCLGLLMGNHEKEYMKHKEQEHLQVWLCKELNTINLGYCAFMDVMFTRNPKTKGAVLSDKSEARGFTRLRKRFFLHHGAGCANTEGGKMSRLIQFMLRFSKADVYMISHLHDETGKRISTIDANERCDKIIDFEKVGVISGGYLKTYQQGMTSYGEVKGYAPTVLGAACVTIKPDRNEVRAVV